MPAYIQPKKRLLSKVELDTNGCWSYTGFLAKTGYGVFGVRKNGKTVLRRAHRVSYEEFVGPIPSGLQLHHTCENKRCINPQHLIPVTPRENTFASDTPARRNSMKTQCPKGHQLLGENLYLYKGTQRSCKKCRTEASKRWKKNYRLTDAK